MKKYQYLASWDDQTLTRVGEPVVVLGDSNVSQVEVTLPSNFLLDPTEAVARMYFLLPGEKESGFETLETATKDENGDSHVTWTIKHVHSQKGGRLAFSLTLIGDDAQWDSRTAIIPVYESRYQPESEEAEEPYTGRLDALEGSMASIRGEFAEVQGDFEELNETITTTASDLTALEGKVDTGLSAINDKVDNMIIESGTSDAETITSRTDSVTGKTYSTLGNRLDTQFGEIKEDLSAEDIKSNTLNALINYGYDTPYDRAEDPEGYWYQQIGVKRNDNIIVLNKQTPVNANVRIRVNGAIAFAANYNTLDAWTDGVALKSGHEYSFVLKLLSGSSVYQGTPQVPPLSIYKAGGHVSVGSANRSADGLTHTRVFIADDNTTYNFAIHIAKNEYVLTNAVFLLTLEDVTENADISTFVPSYYFNNDYLPNRVNAILGRIKDSAVLSSDDFFWFTDPHFWQQPGEATNGMRGVALINYIQSKTNIAKIFQGGDLASSSTLTADECTALIEAYREYMAPLWDNTYNLIGNHEWNNPAQTAEQEANMLSVSQIYAQLIKEKETRYGGVSSRGDYYIDNAVQKIRYFCLGSNPNQILSAEQIRWFGSALGTTPDGFTVVVLSHLGLKEDATYNTTIGYIANMLDAAKSKGSTTYGNTTFDYSNLNVEVACMLTGHIHRDLSTVTTGGVPIISTTCDRGPKAASSESFNTARAYGTINEQAIDVVHIDTSAKKVYLTRIGGSYDGTGALENPDREFSY